MDKALKQRLVGASVLVALAVIVLPMLLGGQPEPGQDARPIEIPPKPRETSFETRRFPIGDQPSSQPSVVEDIEDEPTVALQPPAARPAIDETVDESAESAGALTPANDDTGASMAAQSAETAEAVKQAAGGEVLAAAEPETTPVEAPAPPPEQAPGPTPEPVTAPVTAAAGGRYLVQVASFSATGNATRLATRLRDQGLPVIEDTVDSEAGTLHRVRLGPFDQQAQADQAIASLRQQYSDLNPRVLDLRPGDEAPVTAPSDPLVRWVVQLGSFGEAENAEQLVFRLRDAGYSAFSVAVSGTSGTSHKVRVGPTLSRDDAVRLESDIESSMGLAGLVMSTD
ncbi:hypothetical protein F3N42_07800 [Marinihelvus fidelis]|uniref:SPOR domain-containing protein n=1 Tax=Marinihelvus fidelis TaxID=2613842 RepID=A0A5N0TCB8_9GAMM|nr:SPOR domain-containing protein [Marinihelvus fidelis]KAA9132064.1 hypothetical protein F3N42_07800 [Marinihelvus fidelis]